MECRTARELYAGSLAAGGKRPEEVDAHVAACRACSEELTALAAIWTALGSLPLVEPRPEIGRRLRHRLRAEAARGSLASLGHWQQAALVGVVAFVLSVLLSLAVPYHTMVAVCRDIVPKVLPTPGSYLIAGLLYGLLPLTIGSALQGRLASPQTVLGALEATLIFGAVLAPYVVLRCGEFPHSLLVGFVGGIALGGLAGALAGTWLTRRIVRMEVPA